MTMMIDAGMRRHFGREFTARVGFGDTVGGAAATFSPDSSNSNRPSHDVRRLEVRMYTTSIAVLAHTIGIRLVVADTVSVIGGTLASGGTDLCGQRHDLQQYSSHGGIRINCGAGSGCRGESFGSQRK